MAAPATPPAPHGFYDYFTFILSLLTQPLVFMTILAVLFATRYRQTAVRFVLWLRETFTSFKAGGVEVEFRELKERVIAAESKATEAIETARRLEVQRSELDNVLSQFSSSAAAGDLDELASRLKPIAAVLADTSSFVADLAPGTPQDRVFGAVVGAFKQPKPEFMDPLVDQLGHLVRDPELRGFRLKTVYRLVMAIEAVVRTDNRLQSPLLDQAARKTAVTTLQALAVSPRTLADDSRNGPKGLGARIQRVLKLLRAA